MRSTISTAATAQAGRKRLSSSEARQRLQLGGSGATLSSKLATRRSEAVTDLMPAGGGVTKPAPERLFFAVGAEGKAAYETAMAEYSAKELGGNAKQVRVGGAVWVAPMGSGGGGGCFAGKRVLA